MEFYSHYNPPPKSGIVFTEETLTQQHFKDECDVNKIVEGFTRGIMPASSGTGISRQPMFGDFSNIPDLREAQQRIREAKENFYKLGSRVRRRFNNDPVQLLEFLEDEGNRAEAEKLGLVVHRETATSTTTEEVKSE